MDKPILITGGTGFIASYLAMHLLEAHEQVVLLDCNPDMRRITGFNKGPSDPADPKFDPKDRYNKVKDRLTFVQGDLTSLPHVLAIFDTHEPKSVFHLGALLSSGAEANPTFGFDVDLLGAKHVMEAARIYCQHRKVPPVHVLFPSTIASFGLFPFGDTVRPPKPEDKFIVPNEAVQMPTTIYGLSKVSVERLGEYYNAKGWIDFRAVRFPSVIGAARGPGGTTVYSTLMVQAPLLGQSYEAYVPPDTRLDILYVKDAVRALVGLHAADPKSLKRRVYNIAGVRIGDQAPQASDIEAAVKKVAKQAVITYKDNPVLSTTVKSFGVLSAKAAHDDWKWSGPASNLDQAVSDFANELKNYPNRIKSIELY